MSSPPKTSTLSPRSAAARLVDALAARGIDTFFGIPGGPVCAVFDALRCHGGVRLIESRHESQAAFAAAAYFRATGRVAAVVVTAGPGVTNVVSGLASASLEWASMLVIAGDVAWATTGERMAQDSGPEGIDAESICRSITRACVRVSHARSAVSQAMAALDAALDPRCPGPALLVLPLNHAMAECEAVELRPPKVQLSAPVDASSIDRALQWLREASRPLMVLGAGCRGHEDAVARLADALGIPFVTTPRAKGLVTERHPRSLRNGGMAASIWARRYTAQPVDACLVLGTDLDDTSMGPTRYLGAGGRLVHVDLDSAVFGRNLPTALGVNADVGAFAQALAREAVRTGFASAAAAVAHAHACEVPPFDEPDPDGDLSVPIRPHKALRELEASTSAQTRFITDIGEHMLFALHYLTAERSDAFSVQLNLGSMGSGIGGAIGLGLADPTRRVVCVVGDGCMQMGGMEALVALRHRLPILFAVFNDGRYNMVHHGMRQIFGQADPYDTAFIDFSAWAASFGLPAAVIDTPGKINSVLLERLLARGPALLDIRIDPSVRIRGGGRVEALQHMSMLSQLPKLK